MLRSVGDVTKGRQLSCHFLRGEPPWSFPQSLLHLDIRLLLEPMASPVLFIVKYRHGVEGTNIESVYGNLFFANPSNTNNMWLYSLVILIALTHFDTLVAMATILVKFGFFCFDLCGNHRLVNTGSIDPTR